MTRLLCVLLCAGWAASQAPSRSVSPGQLAAREGAPAFRFHHLHLAVPDPASAMNALAAKVQGTREIVQGLGVGVRSGGQYVLFERGGDPPIAGGASAAERYRRAVAWLTRHGATVEPQDFERSAFAAMEAPGLVDHVAFSAPDLAAAVSVLGAAGAAPVSRTEEAARFAIGDGETVEIVRETDRPDAFWCPMHLDIRSAAPGSCAICGMDLVPIPAPRLGEYRLDVEPVVSPARGRAARLRGLRLRVSDPDGRRVAKFATVHEREFHLFVIGRSLEYFAHVHPEKTGEEGRFDIEHELPPGEYMLLADFLPYGGTTQMLQRALVTPGYGGRLFGAPPVLVEGPAETVVDGVRVRIAEADLAAGKPGCLQFTLADAASGEPITDLEPFLGAPAHLLIVKPDLTDAVHGHPEEHATGGPTVSFDPRLPAPGLYKLWVQFQRKGSVSTAAFVVSAR